MECWPSSSVRSERMWSTNKRRINRFGYRHLFPGRNDTISLPVIGSTSTTEFRYISFWPRKLVECFRIAKSTSICAKWNINYQNKLSCTKNCKIIISNEFYYLHFLFKKSPNWLENELKYQKKWFESNESTIHVGLWLFLDT